MTFVKTDLSTFRPKTDTGFDYGEAGASNFGAETATEPRFPKSLYLVRPLFTSYDLNPVAASAQESVPIPEGLDLDSWIIPPPRDEVAVPIQEDTEAAEALPKKSKKGKGKDVAGKAKGKKKKTVADDGPETLAGPPETEEEKVERERVRHLATSALQ